MKVSVQPSGDSVIVAPEGDVDLNVSPQLQGDLREAISKKPSKLIVDLAQVPYMDSSGVATLVDAMQQTRQVGAELVLCALQPKVLSIFEITRLDAVFTIVPTVKDA